MSNLRRVELARADVIVARGDGSTVDEARAMAPDVALGRPLGRAPRGRTVTGPLVPGAGQSSTASIT